MKKINMSKDLERLNKFVNYNTLLNSHYFSNQEVVTYYKKNKYLLYRIFGSRDGFMHVGLSQDGKYHKNKGYEQYQIKEIESFIISKQITNVCELGCGQGANLNYIASKLNNVNFIGVDLLPSIDKNRDNVTLIKQDYHDLSSIPTASIGLVYAIETLCYSTEKEKLFKEIDRILKPGGYVIIFDGYRVLLEQQLSETDKTISFLVEKGFSMNKFEPISSVNRTISEIGFDIIEEENLKSKALPHMKDAYRRINGYLKFGILFQIFCRIMPKPMIHNIFSVYFMGPCVESDIFGYYKHILQKK